MSEQEIFKFTESDLDCCWPAYKVYFLEVLNGEYPLENAREDLHGLIGTKWDCRQKEYKGETE